MKHLYPICGLKPVAVALLLCVSAAFVSCGGSSRDEISASALKSQLNDGLKNSGEDFHYASVKVGYYEENSDRARYVLRQLAAAGVLTYEVERIETKVSVKSGYDWWTGRTSYKQVNKKVCFVHVALTDAGKKAVLKELPESVLEEDADLANNRREDYYPEQEVPEQEYFPEPKAETAAAEPAPAPAPEPKPQQANPETPKAEPAPAPEPKPKSEYEQAKEREHSETVCVRTYKMRVTKVRNIRLSDGEARFEVIVECYDVTPFGRVFNNVYEGDKSLHRGEAVYFEDKGWKVMD